MIFKKKFDVVTFGSSTIDVFINTEAPEKNNKITYPVGEKILIKGLKEDWGGGGTNTAVAFSRLGLKTGWIGKVGDDENSEKILKNLKKEGIEFLGKKGEGKGGYSVILDSREHNRTILTHKGLNNKLKYREIPTNSFKTDWLYYSSLLEESFKSQKKLALEKVRDGTKLAFNPSDYLIKEKDLSNLLKLTEILVLNKEEAGLLLDKNGKRSKTKNLLKDIYGLGPNIITITNKDKKTWSYDGENFYSVKPDKRIKVVERTGAGDAFASGFVAGIIAGKSIKESLKLGKKEARSVIKYFGAKNNLIKKKIK